MKSRLTFAIVSAILLVSPAVMAASVSLVTKKADSKDSTRSIYVYNYTCSNSSRGTLNVWAVKDSDAQKQAELQARTVCEEP